MYIKGFSLCKLPTFYKNSFRDVFEGLCLHPINKDTKKLEIESEIKLGLKLNNATSGRLVDKALAYEDDGICFQIGNVPFNYLMKDMESPRCTASTVCLDIPTKESKEFNILKDFDVTRGNFETNKMEKFKDFDALCLKITRKHIGFKIEPILVNCKTDAYIDLEANTVTQALYDTCNKYIKHMLKQLKVESTDTYQYSI